MNNIKAIRESKGLTQAELAALMETTDATIQRKETGKRGLSQAWIERFSAALQVSVSEIMGNVRIASPNSMPVKGIVQAGIWRGVDDPQEDKFAPLPIGPDLRFMGTPQFALKVEGESMNRTIPSGNFIICIPWYDLGREVDHDDLVVVQRTRSGLVESTVKRAKVENGKVLLYPESHDPKWQSPLALGTDNEFDEVVIVGLVIGIYQQV